jgi:titin
LIQGNYIGVDSTGTTGSGSFTGIAVSFGQNVTIGGTTTSARNIISGHSGDGVVILGDEVTETFNLVQGNYIGTDFTGTIAVANNSGVVLALAKKTTIGGEVASARNVISGNHSDGIAIVPGLGLLGCTIFGVPGPTHSIDFPVIGNYIGVDASGTQPLGNQGSGVDVSLDAFSHEVRNNHIAYNSIDGVVIPETSDRTAGFPAFSIKIVDNSIYSNVMFGIDLAADGVTQNDLQDADSGANLRQNFPILTSSSIPTAPSDRDIGASATLSVNGTFNSTPNSTFTLQFFFGSGCDASGHQFIGAIPIPLGSLALMTDGNGNAAYSFSFEFPTGTSTGFVNSLATDSNGNTSEASACIAVVSPLAIVSACKGEGKQLVINGSGFASGAKVFLNGDQEKTIFVSSTQVIAKKAGKRAQTGDTLKVRNPDGSETAVLLYTRNNCSP